MSATLPLKVLKDRIETIEGHLAALGQGSKNAHRHAELTNLERDYIMERLKTMKTAASEIWILIEDRLEAEDARRSK